MKKKQKVYALCDGMVLKKEFYGRYYELRVIQYEDGIKFKIDDKLFASLTAAARYVLRDETRQVSGPDFWNAPLAED